MTMTNDINQYKNVVELLKQALLFYGNKNNYFGEMKNASMIDLDEHGSQARFALDQLKKLEDLNEKMENNYENIINSFDETKNQEELLKTIDNLKNFTTKIIIETQK